MYPQSEIQDIIENLGHCMTVRGDLVAECILFHGKNIENRTRKITHKYLALHLGTGKINKDVEKHLLENIDNRHSHKFKKGHICAILKMGKAKHINELNKEEQKNKWVWRGGKYVVSNFIEKVYILENPIKSRGFQSQTYKLECVDNALKQKNKFEKSLKEKITEELKNITVGNNQFFDMIGQDCEDIIKDYKEDIEQYDNDIQRLEECINLTGRRKGKVFHANLSLGEIKQYYTDKNHKQEVQMKIEVHKEGVLNSKYYDINLSALDMNNKYLKNLKVSAFWNSYVDTIICLDIGVFTGEEFDILIEELDDIIFNDDNDSDINYDDVLDLLAYEGQYNPFESDGEFDNLY